MGDRGGHRFRAGDRVEVILDRILADERKLQFSLVQADLPANGKKTAKPPTQSKKSRAREKIKEKEVRAKKLKPRKHLARKGKRR